METPVYRTPEPAAAQPLSLDEAREYFYVAQRACERFIEQLRVLVAELDGKQAGDAWLERVQQEASKGVHFCAQQLDSFAAFSSRTDAYVAGVRSLAADLAMQELRGESPEPGDDEQGRTVHPELARFKAEKQARILGKLGGVPALGPGSVLPVAPRGQVLRATESPAAREIQYSRVEGKDARYLAGVFQFKKHSEGPATASSPWQQEVTERRGRFVSESAVDVPSSTQLASDVPCASELSGVLQQRQAALALVQQQDEEAAAAAAAASRRSSEGASTTPELAEKLRRRQEELAQQLQRQQQQDREEGMVTPPPATPPAAGATPLMSELAGLLNKRNSRSGTDDAAPATGRVSDASSSGLPQRNLGVPAADSELAQKLRKRQSLVDGQITADA